MVRHTAVDVPPGTCYGRRDVPLRESFEVEAEAVRNAIAGAEFDAVWCSPLSRCVHLARACGHGDAVRDERLLEINFGEWEGRLFDEIHDPGLALWYADYLHARPTGGETFDEQRERVAAFLDDLRSNDPGRVLVFTHAGVMLAAGIEAGLFTAGQAFSHIPPHGGIMKLSL